MFFSLSLKETAAAGAAPANTATHFDVKYSSVFVLNKFCLRLRILFDLDKWVYIFVWQTDKMQYYNTQMDGTVDGEKK